MKHEIVWLSKLTEVYGDHFLTSFPGGTRIPPATTSQTVTTPQPPRPSTAEPLIGEVSVHAQTTPGNGPSSGTVAGIVIGVLLAVAIVGGIIFVVVTGRTQRVLTSVRSVGSRARTSAARRYNAATGSMAGFSNNNYDNTDKNRIAEDPNFSGAQDDSYTWNLFFFKWILIVIFSFRGCWVGSILDLWDLFSVS